MVIFCKEIEMQKYKNTTSVDAIDTNSGMVQEL